MKLVKRPYQDGADFWRLRVFLREVFHLNERLERSWSVPRLDYWRWHFILTCESPPMEQVTALWETPQGVLAAFAHAIFKGEVYLQVHPHFREFELEHHMLAWAEEHLSMTHPQGGRVLYTLADQDDALRIRVLEERNYTWRDRPVTRWRRDLDSMLPDSQVATGYTLRSMGGPEDFQARAWASWRAFHPDEPDSDFEGGDWFANLQSAPLYRRDLDLVAEAPGGEIAAFCTIFLDEAARSAVCVLVGTAPEHQRKGLGKALIHEGLKRTRQMGGTRVFANGFDAAGNGLYGAALGSGYQAGSWFKILA